MSKVDALRALREAKYAAATAAVTAAATAAATKAPARPAAAPVKRTPVALPVADAPEGVCGHRNMGGKTCTREADHQRGGTKNHRYS